MGCCDWCCSVFCGCCYRSRYQKADAHTQPLNLSLPAKPGSVDELLERSQKARADAWKKLGKVHPINTTYLKPPASNERSQWPAKRQAYQLIQRPDGSIILASDGLSDPFDDPTLGDGNVNGFGLEFFVECPAGELTQKGDDIAKCWQFQLLYTVSQLAAGHGGIRSILDDMKLLSTEAEGVNEAIPADLRAQLVNEQGRVGALLGLKASSSSESGVPASIEGTPLTEVLLVNIKLLTLSELRLITDKGTDGRRQLSDGFTGPDRLRSSLHRASVL